MYQYDDPSCVASLPAPAAAGTPGYFTDGNPVSGQAPTILTADYMNSLMLELLNVVKAAGITPGKTVYDQLLSAIRRIGQNTVVLADVGTANAYAAANGTPLVAATWVDGVVQAVKIAHTNTGASTYAPDGLAAIPVYGLGLQPLQGGELCAGGTAIFMRTTIASVNSGNPICVLMECAGGAQQIPSGSYGSTPAQFDNSMKLATTGFVQRALGNRQGVVNVVSSITLTPAQAGSLVEINGGAGVTVTLPPTTGIAGAAFSIYNNTGTAVAVSAATGQNINLGRTNVAGFALQPGGTCDVVTDGMSWEVFGEAMLPYSAFFAGSIGSAGYQKLPSGLIVQWGVLTASTGWAWVYPTAFPTGCLGALCTNLDSGASYSTIYNTTASYLNGNRWNPNGTGASAVGAIQLLVIGR